MRWLGAVLCGALVGCSRKPEVSPPAAQGNVAATEYFRVDPAAAGSLTGTIRYTGTRPTPKNIDMSEDPACVQAHGGKAADESVMVGRQGGLANAFVYVRSGLEGKNFAAPEEPVTIDQKGCWFHPRVLGLQVGQTLEIVNSDPVTHNIHPLAVVNREWNHSQGAGDPPMKRKFQQAEVMIPVKCNIHSWMHASLGVLSHPYFAVTGEDGSFAIRNLPAGTYTLAVWTERLGAQEQQVTIGRQASSVANFVFKGK